MGKDRDYFPLLCLPVEFQIYYYRNPLVRWIVPVGFDNHLQLITKDHQHSANIEQMNSIKIITNPSMTRKSHSLTSSSMA